MRHIHRIQRGEFSPGWLKWTLRHPIKSAQFTIYILKALLAPLGKRLLRLWQAF